MLLEPTPELEAPPKRKRPLVVSLAVHALLLALLWNDPGLFDSRLKRIIRIEGNDYDAVKLTELELLPLPRPAPRTEASTPLPEPPREVLPAPPPEPPPPPPMPPAVIRPDDVIAPGARPDGQAQASRGSTAEQLRQGGGQEDSPPPIARAAAPPAPPPSPPSPANTPSPPLPANTNPNAMTVPNLAQRANQIADQAGRVLQRGSGSSATMGPRTGRANALSGQNYSTDGGVQILSDTKGYDFGSYMDQVVNRVRINWSIPDRARFGARGRVIIDFTITKNGDIVNCHIISASGESSLDGAAKAAIDLSNPFQKLPSGFSGNELQLRFGFYYNIPVE